MTSLRPRLPPHPTPPPPGRRLRRRLSSADELARTTTNDGRLTPEPTTPPPPTTNVTRRRRRRRHQPRRRRRRRRHHYRRPHHYAPPPAAAAAAATSHRRRRSTRLHRPRHPPPCTHQPLTHQPRADHAAVQSDGRFDPDRADERDAYDFEHQIGYAFLNATNYVRETNGYVPIYVQRWAAPMAGFPSTIPPPPAPPCRT